MRGKLLLIATLWLLLALAKGQGYNGRVLVIKGNVFVDENGNTIKDNLESGIGNVYIYPVNNAVNYLGQPLLPQYSSASGNFFWDGLMERTHYVFNISNPAGYLFESYDVSLTCPSGKTCVRSSVPADGYAGSVVIEFLRAFQVPLIRTPSAVFNTSTLSLQITIDMGPISTPEPASGIALIGNIFLDDSGNGLKEFAENYYSGLTIALYDSNGNPAVDKNGRPVPNSVTDTNGRFVFEGVDKGKYSIKILDVPSGVHNPGLIGPFQISDKNIGASSANDNVKSPYSAKLGEYGLSPKGSSQCSGRLYYDLDFDNIYSGRDRPCTGVVIKIYSPIYGFIICKTITDSEGRWSCPGLIYNVNYRCEVSDPSLYFTGSNPYTFVQGGQSNINIGVSNQIVNAGQLNANNPSAFATTCFVKGQRTGTYRNDAAVIRFSANATGNAYSGDGIKYAQKMAYHNQVGSVFGITYRPETEDTYVSAFYKGFSDWGPNGAGAIYRISKGFQVSLFVDLNRLLWYGISPTVPHYFNNQQTEISTATIYNLKVSLGDMKSTSQYLYVSNLNTNEIIQIPLQETPTQQNTVKRQVPNPGCTYSTDWRIFALELYQNQLYVGGVCTGESGSSLTAFVVRYNEPTGSWINVIEYPLNYNRGCMRFDYCPESQWHKWSSNYKSAQPQLAALYFDDVGRMIMGFKDRGSDSNDIWISTPDLLVACQSPDGEYVLEYNGVCGGRTGALPNALNSIRQPMGLGGGYYFNVQQSAGHHDHNVAYGLARAGPQMMVSTGMDMNYYFEGVVRWFNTSTGQIIRGYSVYNTSIQPGTFGKNNGLGSITPIYPASNDVVECGRIWNDLNGNGIQDCNEVGIPGVKVFIYTQSNPQCPITYLESDKDGRFCFKVLPGERYTCVIGANEVKAKFGKFELSPVLNNPALEAIDSDGILVNGNLVSQYQASPYCGYQFDHCHFGVYDPDKCPKNFGQYGWGNKY